MTKFEELIKRHVGENDLLINVKDYKGVCETDFPIGSRFFYTTHKVNRPNDGILMECLITEKHNGGCASCPMADFACNSINCNAKPIKIYRK